MCYVISHLICLGNVRAKAIPCAGNKAHCKLDANYGTDLINRLGVLLQLFTMNADYI